MRKRKRKYTWFPNFGSASQNVESVPSFTGLKAQLTVPPNGDIVVALNPMVTDPPLEGEDINRDTDRLVQVLGNEYIIRRIVGRCFLSCDTPADDDPAAIFPKTFLIGVGFFVARANDTGSGGGHNTPIGSATNPEAVDNYSTLALDTDREPWMFFRTYILSSGRLSDPAGTGTVQTRPWTPSSVTTGVGGPKDNLLMSGLMSPHFDVKSMRRVRDDERLFVSFSARTLDNEFLPADGRPNTVAPEGVSMYLDYRVLGALRRAKSRSNF